MNHDLKFRPRVAKLRRELAALTRQLRRDRRQSKPDLGVMMGDAFRRGLKMTPEEAEKHFSTKVCFSRRGSDSMAVNLETPSFLRLAEVYQTSPQALRGIMRRHELDAQDLADPARVFDTLLENGRASKTRKLLVDPATRQAIAEEINMLQIRGPFPSTKSKISNII